ncbi:MAG: 50S ribosomal protein L29 [Candidatus Omnitrophica bacterium]|nr:50S ribosomal protein L29 [Candidatus Omnitrophota bacterium]
MKAKELINLNREELLQKIKVIKEELFKLNMQRYGGRVEKPHMFGSLKKDLARIKTVLKQKKE